MRSERVQTVPPKLLNKCSHHPFWAHRISTGWAVHTPKYRYQLGALTLQILMAGVWSTSQQSKPSVAWGYMRFANHEHTRTCVSFDSAHHRGILHFCQLCDNMQTRLAHEWVSIPLLTRKRPSVAFPEVADFGLGDVSQSPQCFYANPSASWGMCPSLLHPSINCQNPPLPPPHEHTHIVLYNHPKYMVVKHTTHNSYIITNNVKYFLNV